MPFSIAAGGASLLGGIIGGAASSGDRSNSLASAQAAVKAYTDLGVPSDLATPIVIQQLKQQGIYTPELETALNAPASKVAAITEDPSLRNASVSALNALKTQGQTGLTASDRAAFNQLRNTNAQDLAAKQAQIIQNMQQRGQGGGGAELAQQIAASQAGANQAYSQGDDLAAQASKNALAAMTNAGNLGGSIRSQDFGVNQARAQAADELNRFNVSNQQNVGNTNVGAQNQAQVANLAEKQRIADQNSQNAYNEQVRQKQAEQQQYEDAVQRASGIAGNDQHLAQDYSNNANATGQSWANIGSGVGSLAGTLAKMPKSSGGSSDLKQMNSPDYGWAGT